MKWTMTQNQKQDIARLQLSLEKWTNLERMRQIFEKHKVTQLDRPEK